ncbi:unnamed protein product, partial [Symbiodinium microadriaticum]
QADDLLPLPCGQRQEVQVERCQHGQPSGRHLVSSQRSGVQLPQEVQHLPVDALQGHLPCHQ